MTTLVLALVLASDGQPGYLNHLQSHEYQADALFLASNVVFGCLVGGLGSVYNDSSFVHGCKLGVRGGTVAFGSQWLAAHAADHPGIGALAHLLANVGNSITQAGVEGHDFNSVYFDFGPMGITLGQLNGHSRVSFSLVSLYGLWDARRKGVIDWTKTLDNLTPVYQSKVLDSGQWNGETFGNVVSVGAEQYQLDHRILSHELVHAAQWSMFQVFNQAHVGPWNLGQDATDALDSLSEFSYYHDPFEIEAYSLAQGK